MRAVTEMRMLGWMVEGSNREVDCAGCVGGVRCWGEPVASGAGFVVRRIRPLEPGDLLFQEGEPFKGPYVVTSGCVSVTQLHDNGVERIVAFRVAGEIVGLESCNRRSHLYGAQAVSSATVCRLRWTAGGIQARGAPWLRALLAKASNQMENAAPPWAGLSSVERVRQFIDDFERRTDQPLPMTRAHIGRYLGLAEETVVRAFGELRRAGVRNA